MKEKTYQINPGGLEHAHLKRALDTSYSHNVDHYESDDIVLNIIMIMR